MVSFDRSFHILYFYSIILFALGHGEKEKQIDEARDSSEEERIVGGTEAKKSEFPWIVHLRVKGGVDRECFCGGSIISPNWILTAGHCVENATGSAVTVIAGVIRRNDKKEEGRQERQSGRVILHDKYKFRKGEKEPPVNDVALIMLSSPLQLSDTVKPIRLADRLVNDTSGAVVVAGWGTTEQGTGSGVTEELRKADLSIVDRDICQKRYKQRPDGPLLIRSNELCAAAPGKGVCQGDSGDPLMCTQGDTVYACGILSWGVGCAREQYPSVYSRVKSHKTWITLHAHPWNNNSPCFNNFNSQIIITIFTIIFTSLLL